MFGSWNFKFYIFWSYNLIHSFFILKTAINKSLTPIIWYVLFYTKNSNKQIKLVISFIDFILYWLTWLTECWYGNFLAWHWQRITKQSSYVSTCFPLFIEEKKIPQVQIQQVKCHYGHALMKNTNSNRPPIHFFVKWRFF